MDVDDARERNVQQSEEQAREGPVVADPSTTPIGDAIEAYHRRGEISFAIFAHRSGLGRHVPGATRWAGEQAFAR